MLHKVINLDKGANAISSGWPIKHSTRQDGDDELTDLQYRQLLEDGGVPGKKYYKVALSHPQDYIAFKAQHKRTMSGNLKFNGGQFYEIVPHLGTVGHSNLYIVYWHWERKNRPKPPTASQVLSNMPGPTGSGLGNLLAKSEQRHVIAVVASNQNTLIQSGWPVIAKWNGPMTLWQLGNKVGEWYSSGSPGAPGKGPGGMDNLMGVADKMSITKTFLDIFR
jgi:hypothetical protein